MGQFHVFFFPMMAHGHMIPTLDLAKLFAARGVEATIVTTPLNAPYFSRSIQRSNEPGLRITVRTIDFPAAEVGLPANCETVDEIPSDDTVPLFFRATSLLQRPFEELLRDSRPDCVVASTFFPWAAESAAKFGIPRLVFHVISFFSLCASASLRLNKPHLKVSSDDEPFVVPNLPHQVKLTRSKLSDQAKEEKETYMTEFLKQVRESEATSYGVIVNSFYELEPEYAYHYRNVMGVKAWHVGPVSLCNGEVEDKAERGKKASISEHDCLKWLDSKKPNSVVYVCFGSIAKFTNAQLFELAMGLEASEQPYIWVVRKGKSEDGGGREEWSMLPGLAEMGEVPGSTRRDPGAGVGSEPDPWRTSSDTAKRVAGVGEEEQRRVVGSGWRQSQLTTRLKGIDLPLVVSRLRLHHLGRQLSRLHRLLFGRRSSALNSCVSPSCVCWLPAFDFDEPNFILFYFVVRTLFC